MKTVEIPHEQIESETLRRLIVEYIARDGTFYGEIEMTLDRKVDMIMEQMESGKAVVTWDLESQTSNIVLKDEMEKKTEDLK